MTVRWVLAVCCLFSSSLALKILVYHAALSRSHLMFSGTLVDILADAGHQVHVLIADWDPRITENGTKKAESVRRFTLSEPSPWMEIYHVKDPFEAKVVNYHMDSREATLHWRTVAAFCEEMLADDDLLRWLRDSKFDVVVSTTYDFCAFGLFHVAGIRPVLGFLPTPISDILLYVLGISNPASHTQDSFYPSEEGDQMNYLQRASNLYTRTLMQTIYIPRFIALQEEIYRRRFGPDVPSLQKLFSQMSYVFVNAHELIDYPRPVTHKLVFIGGITFREVTTPLPQEYDRILSERPAGAVLFSFGSIAQTSKMPEHAKSAFMEAFASFPQYTFIWKFDENTSATISNVYQARWLPQKQLLADGRVKAFITHIGLNSLYESIQAGVPMVGVPLFGDQLYNSGIVQRWRLGMIVDKHNITAENIRNALTQVLINDCCHQNVQRLSAMIRKSAKDPKRTFVEHVELAAAFPDIGDHLQLQSTNLNLIQYFCLDIIIPVLAVLALSLYVSIRMLLLIFRMFTRSEEKVKFQ